MPQIISDIIEIYLMLETLSIYTYTFKELAMPEDSVLADNTVITSIANITWIFSRSSIIESTTP